MTDVRAARRSDIHARRRWQVRWIGGVGLVLLLLSVCAVAGIMVGQLGGYRWSDAALVPVDGQPHEVDLGGEGTALLWTDESGAHTTCTVADAVTGSDLPLSTSGGRYWREYGSAGDWVGTAEFLPLSGTVVATCSSDAPHRGEVVAIERRPVVPPLLAAFGRWVWLPLALGLSGLLAVAAALAMLAARAFARR